MGFNLGTIRAARGRQCQVEANSSCTQRLTRCALVMLSFLPAAVVIQTPIGFTTTTPLCCSQFPTRPGSWTMDHERGREESSHELSSFDVLGRLRSFPATTTLDPSLIATSLADAAQSQPHYSLDREGPTGAMHYCCCASETDYIHALHPCDANVVLGLGLVQTQNQPPQQSGFGGTLSCSAGMVLSRSAAVFHISAYHPVAQDVRSRGAAAQRRGPNSIAGEGLMFLCPICRAR